MPEFKNVKVPDFKSIYANQAAFQSGPFDFAITFGEITQVDMIEETAIVEQRVRVTMSPLHSKIFATLFSQQVRAFEAKFGEIIIPPGILAGQPENESEPVTEAQPQGK